MTAAARRQDVKSWQRGGQVLQRERLTRDESTKSGCGVVEQSKKLGINESGRGRSSLSLFDERTGQGKSYTAQAVGVAAQTVMYSPVVSGACDEQGKGGSGSWKRQEDQRPVGKKQETPHERKGRAVCKRLAVYTYLV